MREQALTPAQLAAELGVSARTAANWRWLGVGPRFFKLGQGRSARVRYRREDVDEWLAAQARQGGAAA